MPFKLCEARIVPLAIFDATKMPPRMANRIVLRNCFRFQLQLRPFSTDDIFAAWHDALQVVSHDPRDLLDFWLLPIWLACPQHPHSDIHSPSCQKRWSEWDYFASWKVRLKAVEIRPLSSIQTCSIPAFVFFTASFKWFSLQIAGKKSLQGFCSHMAKVWQGKMYVWTWNSHAGKLVSD